MLDMPSVFSPCRKVLHLFLRLKCTPATLANPEAEETCNDFLSSFYSHYCCYSSFSKQRSE